MEVPPPRGVRTDVATFPGASGVSTIHVGVTWTNTTGEDSDVDLGVVALSREGEVEATVYWGQLAAFAGAIRHNGDATTRQDDAHGTCEEVVVLDLLRIPSNVASVAFLVTNYEGASLASVRDVRLVVRCPGGTGNSAWAWRSAAELAAVACSAIPGNDANSFIAAALIRRGDSAAEWTLTTIERPCRGNAPFDFDVRASLRDELGSHDALHHSSSPPSGKQAALLPAAQTAGASRRTAAPALQPSQQPSAAAAAPLRPAARREGARPPPAGGGGRHTAAVICFAVLLLVIAILLFAGFWLV